MKELEFYVDANAEYRWRLIGKNNRVVAASSESFSSLQNAKKNARLTTWYHLRPDVKWDYDVDTAARNV